MLLRTTAKAHRELHPGLQTLSLRQRSVLLLADCARSDRLNRLFNGMGEQIVGELLEQGYLAPQRDMHRPMLDSPRSPDVNGIEPVQEEL